MVYMEPFKIRPLTPEEAAVIQQSIEEDEYQPWPNDKVHEDLLDFPRRPLTHDPSVDDELEGFSLIP